MGSAAAGRVYPSKVRYLLPLSLLALVIALPAVRADSEDAAEAFDCYLGTYESVDVGRDERTITEALESGTADMPPLRRSVARRRLGVVNRPVSLIEIRREADSLLTIWDGDPYRAPISGAWRRGIDPEGKSVNVSFRVSNRRLVARYVGDDGEKRVHFSLGGEGRRLRLGVLLLSERLPGPIRYQLAYNRR